MVTLATTTLAISDIFNLANSVATLNLGYLGICVTILVLLGGATYVFNIRPFKDTLDKQEKILIELKKEVAENLSSSKREIRDDLATFEKTHTTKVTELIDQEKQTIVSDLHARLATYEKESTEKFGALASEKDSDLRTVIVAEIGNQVRALEKTLTSSMNEQFKKLSERVDVTERKLSSHTAKIEDIKEDVLNLQIEHYLKKSQIGALSAMLDKLKMKAKDSIGVDTILLQVKEYIGGHGMPDVYMSKLVDTLKLISDDYKILKEEITKLATEKVYKIR